MGKRTGTSFIRGFISKSPGGRKKGAKNKEKFIIDLDEPTITQIREARGMIGLQFEQAFREVLQMDRGEFEKRLKLAKEPEKYKNGRYKSLSSAAKKLSIGEVAIYRYFEKLFKGDSLDIDTTRMSFVYDMITGKCARHIGQNKSILVRMKEFIEGIRIKGLDYDFGYADVVRFMFGTEGLTEKELKVLMKVAKELLEIELSRLEVTPKKIVEKQFSIQKDWMLKTFGSQPKLLARYQEGCLTDFKEKLPDGDKVDFPLVKIDDLTNEKNEKVVEGRVVSSKKKVRVKAKKKKTKRKRK